MVLGTPIQSRPCSAALGNSQFEESFKPIEMMMQASNREIEIYDVVISSLKGEFQLRTELTKVDCGRPLSLENPW